MLVSALAFAVWFDHQIVALLKKHGIQFDPKYVFG